MYLVVSVRSQRAKNHTSCHQPRDLLSTEAKIRTRKPHCCPATWQGRERMPEGRMPPRRPSYLARLPGRPCTGCCPLHSLSLVSDFTFYSGFCSQFATVRLPGWSAERSAPRTAPTVPGRQLGQHRKDLRTAVSTSLLRFWPLSRPRPPAPETAGRVGERGGPAQAERLPRAGRRIGCSRFRAQSNPRGGSIPRVQATSRGGLSPQGGLTVALAGLLLGRARHRSGQSVPPRP